MFIERAHRLLLLYRLLYRLLVKPSINVWRCSHVRCIKTCSRLLWLALLWRPTSILLHWLYRLLVKLWLYRLLIKLRLYWLLIKLWSLGSLTLCSLMHRFFPVYYINKVLNKLTIVLYRRCSLVFQVF
ncbi:hypothetical protein [Kochikohdavirus PBEF19]|uniref:Uncharacterized protein n=1 Tax=Enterococcus phage PBEF129 TaxID=2696337 RepID=A0A7T3MLB8_9CAUD|nr:hypothetical protein [Enterococcus phage PBEF129]